MRSRPAARSRARSPSSSRTTRSARSSSRPRRPRATSILIVADAPEVTADVLGRLRVELGDRLGLADPNVLSYVWIHRFPMYQWDTEIGRWHATHNPFSGVLPEDEELLVTASGDPARPSPDGPGRPCAGAPVRPRAQRLGARWRVDPDPPPRPPRALVPAPGPLARGDAREVRGRPRRLRVRRAAARRDRPRHRPLGRPARPPDEHPRGDGLPQDPVGDGPDARGAVDPRAGPVRGARPAVRRRRSRPRPERGHPRGRSDPLDWFAQRPRLAALLGATCIAFSGVFYLFAAVSPSTGTFYRAVFGLPLLVLVALGERRRHGPLPPQTIRLAAIAGIFFTGDLMFWHHAIEAVGAGLATVLGNLQVIIVGFFAWLLLGERPSRATLLALPVVLAGVVLISGVDRRGRLRVGAAARGDPRHRHGDLLRRLPADHPLGRPRPAPAGRSGGGRHRVRGRCAPSWSARSAATST